jgi:hypothetical protein
MALAQHGWWFPEQEASEPNLYGMWDVNVNHLLLNAPSKCGFGSDIKCVLARIYKVSDEQAESETSRQSRRRTGKAGDERAKSATSGQSQRRAGEPMM